MRAMVALVSVMGVLIVAGVVTLLVTIMHRVSSPEAATAAVLDEPAGTRIGGVSAAGERVAVALTGGGPDRVVLLDARTGKVVGRVGLAR